MRARCSFHPTAENLVRASVKALSAAQKSVGHEPVTDKVSPLKAQMLFTLGFEFFYVLAEFCSILKVSEGGTLDDNDVTTLRSCIDVAMGMLYELKSTNGQAGHELPEVIEEREGLEISYELECAGPIAGIMMQRVYMAVVCSQS